MVVTVAVAAAVADVPIVATTVVASVAQLLGVNVVDVPEAVVTVLAGLSDAVNPACGYATLEKLQTIGIPA